MQKKHITPAATPDPKDQANAPRPPRKADPDTTPTRQRTTDPPNRSSRNPHGD